MWATEGMVCKPTGILVARAACHECDAAVSSRRLGTEVSITARAANGKDARVAGVANQ